MCFSEIVSLIRSGYSARSLVLMHKKCNRELQQLLAHRDKLIADDWNNRPFFEICFRF